MKSMRDIEILDRWLDGENYAEIGRSLDLSRERIRQIISEVTKAKTPTKSDRKKSGEVLRVLAGRRVNGPVLRELAGVFGILSTEVARDLGCSPETVRHVYGGGKEYSYGKVPRRIAGRLLEIASDRLDRLSKVLEKEIAPQEQITTSALAEQFKITKDELWSLRRRLENYGEEFGVKKGARYVYEKDDIYLVVRYTHLRDRGFAPSEIIKQLITSRHINPMQDEGGD